MKWNRIALLSGIIAVTVLLIFFWRARTGQDQALQTALDGIVNDYRKIIVLMDGADTLDEATRARCVATGQALFWRKQRSLRDVSGNLTEGAGHEARVEQLIRYLSSDRALHDADKLAFLDLIDELADGRSRSAHPLRALLDNLQSIQTAYREEVTRIFSQFATRGASGGREKWDAYVADLRKRLSREQVLAEIGVAAPEEPAETMRGGARKEVFGTEFPAKTVALTFDDDKSWRFCESTA